MDPMIYIPTKAAWSAACSGIRATEALVIAGIVLGALALCKLGLAARGIADASWVAPLLGLEALALLAGELVWVWLSNDNDTVRV